MGGTLGIIYTIIVICIIIMLILIGVVLYIAWQNKRKLNGESTSLKKNKGETTKAETSLKMQGIESMNKFLAFDHIVDNMIVRKNGEQYVMVIQCKGVNFDLLGEDEKIAVESGFVQFLNILRFPIQLYVQTRRLNLTANIDTYVEKMNEIKEQIQTLDAQIEKEKQNGRMQIVKKLEFDKRRKINILEYGMDITNYVSRMSQNKNVLQQNTYIIISYYKSEFGGDIQNYSKEEIDNIAFSELYTRAQTLIRGISAAGVTGRVLNSDELAELLYVAYNRDDSEIINIKKSVAAEYDSFYNIGEDVLEKQKKLIEKTLDEEAIDLTAKSIKRADRIRQLRRERQEEIKNRALQYTEAYKYEMTEDLYKETKRQIEKADLTGEKKKANAEKVKATKSTTNANNAKSSNSNSIKKTKNNPTTKK